MSFPFPGPFRYLRTDLSSGQFWLSMPGRLSYDQKVLEPLAGLAKNELLGELRRQYGSSAQQLEFCPLGEDSWCYRNGSLWVSVRRDLRGHVPVSYEAAMLLRQAGLDFVLAPLAGRDGKVSRIIGGYPVVVFSYLPLVAVDRIESPGELFGMISAVHDAQVAAALPCETYDLPFDGDLRRILDVASRGVNPVGPYAEPMRALLLAQWRSIAELREEFDDLSRTCAAAGAPFVLSHGEPGRGNVLARGDELMLADWGELMLGPPERDWFHLARAFGLSTPGRPEFLRFYAIRWFFNELTEYGARFFAGHRGDEQDRLSWRHATRLLAGEV